jgi:hypothetical protein
MLQGESKRDYMRDYMRRQRAGEPTRKPKRERGPTPLMVAEVARLFRLQLAGSWRLRDSERKVVAGLDPNNADGTANEAAWNEALRRYRTLRAEQRAERKRKKAERDAPPPPPKCWFCHKPVFAPSILVGPPIGPHICATCTEEAAAIFARLDRDGHAALAAQGTP